jgi:hypothetical protein
LLRCAKVAIGTSRRFAATRQFGRFRIEADIAHILRHAARDRREIILLRLVDVVIELRVGAPDPPLVGQLQSEVATPPRL